jgi:hypothetical protein
MKFLGSEHITELLDLGKVVSCVGLESAWLSFLAARRRVGFTSQARG